MTILDRLRLTAARHPVKTALSAGDRRLTFADLESGSSAAAQVLAESGVEHGERVCLCAGKTLEFVLAYLGALKLGAVCVPANPAFREAELGWILADSDPRVVVCDESRVNLVRSIAPAGVRAVLVIGGGAVRPGGPGPRVQPFGPALQATASAPPQERVSGTDLALIVYTSGTTGRAKGAMLLHSNLVANIEALIEAFGWTAADRLVHALPLFHVHGLCVGLHGALVTGCETHLRTRFDAAETLAALADFRATLFLGVPTMYARLLAAAGGRRPRLPAMRLFVSGSAPLPVGTAERFRSVFGHDLLERYGMTETLITLAQPLAEPRRFGTVGRPVAGVLARVVDADLAEVPDGKPGELLVRGACVGPGYWRNPAATAAAFAAGWFRTGDVAVRDPTDGLYSIVGRQRDLIISGGINVYPREVEEVLSRHPDVAEVAVFGVPDGDLGEAVAAAVVPVPGATPTATELREFCRDRLAPYKKPRLVRFLPALPRNAMGKVIREGLVGPRSSGGLTSPGDAGPGTRS